MSSPHDTLPIDQLLQGDCIEEMQKLPDQSIDVVFADPPYFLQLDKGNAAHNLKRPNDSAVVGVEEAWDQFRDFDAYDQFSRRWLSEARRLLKPDGTLWVMGSYHNIFRIGTALQDLHYWLLNDVIWIKNNPMPNFRGRRFTNAHETLIWCAKDQSSKYYFAYQAMKALNENLQMRSDWQLPICTGKERLKDEGGDKVHPTQKPEALLYRVLLASTRQGEVVLDPFSGTGTTACVARKLRRHFIGIERDAGYLASARDRLANTTPLDDETLTITPSRASKPRVPFGRLIEQGVLQVGDTLHSPCARWKATVHADGSIKSGGIHGSIHQVGAQLQGAASCNGWTYWRLGSKTRNTVPLDHLRQKFDQD